MEGEVRPFFSSSKSVPALLSCPFSSALFQVLLHNFAVDLNFVLSECLTVTNSVTCVHSSG